MGKEGRRFLPNLKKLGSPRLNFDEHWINLNNFDVIGHVTNDDIIKAIKEHENSIVVPDINTMKGILGKDVKGS